MNSLSYVNVFAQDIVRLSTFYSDLFGFREIEAIRSSIFRGLDTGKSCIGFNALDAYELLGLEAFAGSTGCRFLLNIDVSDQAEVDRLVPLAVAQGAKLIKEPYLTYYNWYQAVLLDPEQNVFRINVML
ncbi:MULTISPECIES: VOC family protein [Pseudomonas]|uniref:VOC family protein n=1 Tax=Pseudomonas TaxID=286 RepID=UPI0016561D0B|nr:MULTISPECIES: VOC family protein [Pseudomonas]MBC8880165.1 glyoxalase [Pseudomonas cerasi]MCK9702183.1 glyoxalase [Pseudomonas syringae pv. syringae]MCK9757860.1 glyoxalase [Pseudomonas syringae pv. syringae]MCK9772555.1 glyoxalase [Pseudomonas syringae pv. syringae]QNR42517.1 glyoxalase [Pseudomonas syringae]